MRLGILVLGLMTACGSKPAPTVATAAPSCPALPSPITITIGHPKPGELNELFELPDTPGLWAPTPEDDAAKAYRRALSSRVDDLSPHALLVRQSHMDDWGYLGEKGNIITVLEGRAGHIGAPSCLERRLFARHAPRFPLIEHPTEFGAFVLRGGGRVRIYFSSHDMVGQRIRKEVVAQLEADIRSEGFRLYAHVHSHPFLFDRKVGDRMWTIPQSVNDIAGALVPSLADAGLWKGFAADDHLEEGWITNGLDSNHVPRVQFPLFVGAGDAGK